MIIIVFIVLSFCYLPGLHPEDPDTRPVIGVDPECPFFRWHLWMIAGFKV